MPETARLRHSPNRRPSNLPEYAAPQLENAARRQSGRTGYRPFKSTARTESRGPLRSPALPTRTPSSSASHSENAQKKTGKHNLESKREKHDSGNHNAQRFFRIKRPKVVASPVGEAEHPRPSTCNDKQTANHQADFQRQIAKHPG